MQFRQYSAVAHPITLDSAEINSVDKLLGKQTGKKKKGGNSARTPVRRREVMLLLGRVRLHGAGKKDGLCCLSAFGSTASICGVSASPLR